MIYYYQFPKKILFSKLNINNLAKIDPEKVFLEKNKCLYYLQERDWQKASPLVALIHPEQLSSDNSVINILQRPDPKKELFFDFPDWIRAKIEKREVGLCNINYPRWKERLEWIPPEQWNVNIVGLGNTGGTLLVALRSMAGEKVNSIGIFDTNERALTRWELETNQIIDGNGIRKFPPVRIIKSEEIFQADLVIFSVSMGLHSLESENRDVSKLQLEANSGIIDYYAQRARKNNYNGIFSIVSEPVDLLCQSAFNSSNLNENGILDGKGLAADQIRGLGLGVMHSRAAYYAEQESFGQNYITSGRVFGSTGKGLLIADDVEQYDRIKSSYLSEKVLQANKELIKIGYKPYIASAVSSGALSLIDLMEGKWHYSAGFLGGIFWGSRNRQTRVGLEWEQYNLPIELFSDLSNSFLELKEQAKDCRKKSY